MSFAAIFTSVWAVPRAVLADNLRILTSRTLPVTCDNVVMLSATVIGDPTGHTFEWEQISGESVIWLESVYQTNVMFQQPATRDDKIFHFVVDKGKPIEKRYEVLVTAIPTDILTTSISSDNALVRSATYGITGSTIMSLVPAFGLAGSIEINNPTRALIFNAPYKSSTDPKPPVVTVYEYSGGSLNSLGSIIFDTYLNLTAVINVLSTDKTYRLGTRTFGTVDYSDAISYPSSNFLTYKELAITDSTLYKTSLNSEGLFLETNKELIKRELLSLENSDTLSIPGLYESDSSVFSIVERITRSLTGVDQDKTTENLATSLFLTETSLSSIVEVKQFQYSSLG